MTRNTNGPPIKRHSMILLILTSVYGLLYVVFMATGSYGTTGSEPTVVKLLFLLFLIGYASAWLNEGLAGIIFVSWWIGMWYLGLFISQGDRGDGVVMGLPLFILAILFIRSWYRRTHGHSTAP